MYALFVQQKNNNNLLGGFFMKEEFKRRLMVYAEKKTLRQKVIPGIWLVIIILLAIYTYTKHLTPIPLNIFCILVLIYLDISSALDALIKSGIKARKKNKWIVLIFSNRDFVGDFCTYTIILPIVLIFLNVFSMPSAIGPQILISIILIIIATAFNFFLTGKICEFTRKWLVEDKEIE